MATGTEKELLQCENDTVKTEYMRTKNLALPVSVNLDQEHWTDPSRPKWNKPVLRIRIRRIRVFLGLLDPDPLVRGTDPASFIIF
jgi:hypothetical protein